MKKMSLSILAAAVLSACGGSAYAANWYVAMNGNDSAAGSAAAPFATIYKASTVAAAGDTVHVAPGTYYGGFTTTKDGNSTARLTYISTVPWGAKLVPDMASAEDRAWDQHGDYVDVIGFEVDGQSSGKWVDGIITRGLNVTIKNNYIHHIANTGSCISNGGSGIAFGDYWGGTGVVVDGNVLHDIGLDGCIYFHAIYPSGPGTIKNNVIYRVKGGVGVHIYHDARDLYVVNNTITESNMAIHVAPGGYYNTTKRENVYVINNIAAYNTKGILESPSGAGTLGVNYFYNNLSYGNTDYNFSTVNSRSGDITTDPKFLPSATRFAAIHSSSPAMNAGSTSHMPAADIDGTVRSVTAPDIGAYEY